MSDDLFTQVRAKLAFEQFDYRAGDELAAARQENARTAPVVEALLEAVRYYHEAIPALEATGVNVSLTKDMREALRKLAEVSRG